MSDESTDAELFRVISTVTRMKAAEMMAAIGENSGDDGLQMTAVAHGTLDGVADWMVRTLGSHTAYEILQRRADEIVSTVKL